ncbi:MAG: tetratricopeptide repeat protein [Myxococcota bacterium]
MVLAGSAAPMKETGHRYKLARGVKVDRLDLTMEEGRVAVTIPEEALSAVEITAITQLPQHQVQAILSALVNRGYVERIGPKGPKSTTDSDYGDFIFPAHLMGAECDLDEAQRKRIIFTHSKLENWTYYELLRVRRRDDKAQVTKAFRQRSLEWHPDRFPRNKGPFARYLQEIFKSLEKARKVLSDAKLREEYDQAHGHLFIDPEDLAEMRAKKRREAREAKREQEAIERRRRRNPIRKKLQKAEQMKGRSQDLEESGDLAAALEQARLAMAYDPNNEELKAKFEQLEAATAKHRSEPWIRRGQSALTLAKWEPAIECFRKALEVDPDNGQALTGLAYCLAYGEGAESSLAEASRLATKAVALQPRDPEGHHVQGVCYWKKGMKKKAVESLEKCIELRPNHADAKKLLKKLRWPF